MDIPLNAEVRCADGACGHSTVLIINPVTQAVTHFVLHTKGLHHDDYLVPVELITESAPGTIQIRCRKEEVTDLPPFIRRAVVGAEDLEADTYIQDAMEGVTMAWPYGTPAQASTVPWADVEQVPHGELAIHRGTHVYASEGRVGTVDEFLVNPENGHISHLVLRHGHLWGKRDISVPLGEIDRIDDDVVYLKLDKAAVEQLPHISIKRR